MDKAYILLGSNIQPRAGYLSQAREQIALSQHIISISSIYESEAWGMENADPFLNQVLAISPQLHASDLLRSLKAIEAKLQRARDPKVSAYQSRTIDCDILLFGSQIISTADLTIPHPLFHLRKFALIPLAEILPRGWQHPSSGLSITQLLHLCPDAGWVRKHEISK